MHVLSQPQNGVDRRHLTTLAGMSVGLVPSGRISLTAWVPSVHSRAVSAQSSVRRFARWLEPDRIAGHALYGPLVQQALAAWGTQVLDLALATATRWNISCLVRISIVYRGRAGPLGWKVLDHASRSVAYDVDKEVLEKVAELLPWRWNVVLTAARGFADTHLMAHLARWGGHWRIRIKGRFWLYRQAACRGKVNRLPWCVGKARFWHQVDLTTHRDGPVHLALGRPKDRKAYWVVVSDEPTEVKTFEEYRRRFDLEENFLEDKSTGFQLESSLLRSAKALERRCCIRALTTLDVVAPGPEVVTQGQRRGVDSPWFRGQSDLKIGWDGVKLARSRGYELITRMHLSAAADPVPALASKIQHQKQPQRCFALECQDAVA